MVNFSGRETVLGNWCEPLLIYTLLGALDDEAWLSDFLSGKAVFLVHIIPFSGGVLTIFWTPWRLNSAKRVHDEVDQKMTPVVYSHHLWRP